MSSCSYIYCADWTASCSEPRLSRLSLLEKTWSVGLPMRRLSPASRMPPTNRFSTGTTGLLLMDWSLAPWAVCSMSSSWLEPLSLMAYALFELKAFKSKNSFGKWAMPSSVIKLVTLCFLLRLKHDLQARKHPYLSAQDYVFLTLRESKVFPDCTVNVFELPWKALAERKTGYWIWSNVPNLELLSVK